MAKKTKSFRLSEEACTLLAQMAAATGKNETALLESLILEAGNQESSQAAASLLSAVEQKYDNTITGIRLATRSAEKNIYIVIEMLHSLIMNTLPKNEQIYFPTHRLDISLASRNNDPDKLAALIESQSPIYSSAFEDISDYLTNLKQRKDNRPKEDT